MPIPLHRAIAPSSTPPPGSLAPTLRVLAGPAPKRSPARRAGPLLTLGLAALCAACSSSPATSASPPRSPTSGAPQAEPTSGTDQPTTLPARTATSPSRSTAGGGTATTATVPPSSTAIAHCNAAAAISSWSLARRAAQLVVAPVEEDDVAAALPLVRAGAGGIILFGTAVPANLAAQLDALDAAAPGGLAPIVMTDEEGGAVQRLANAVGDVPSARTMAATMTPSAVTALAAQVGARMRALGIGMDLAPVLDVNDGPGPNASYPDGTRSFSADPATAATYALAFATGLEEAGVVPVVKHFPGLGHASGNTDVGPATTPPLSFLEGDDLIPFRDAIAAGVPVVMVSNATVPGLTTGPASLSRAAVTGLLRDRLGFRGLVMTDSLSAGAIAATGLGVPAAAVVAVAAGVQMLLYTAPSATAAATTGLATIQALVGAVQGGRLPTSVLDADVAAVLRVKGVSACAA